MALVGPNVGTGRVELDIDSAEIQELLSQLEGRMTQEQFERAMYGVFNRVTGKVRGILAKDVPRRYEVMSGEVRRTVQDGRVTTGGGQVGCVIPLKGPRFGHANKSARSFKAKGGAHGWVSLHKKYRVSSKIYKGSASLLPITINGQKPFRNLSAPKLNMHTYVREGKPRLPIDKVVGISIPQMPMNKARPEVERDIVEYLEDRIYHRFIALLENGQ